MAPAYAQGRAAGVLCKIAVIVAFPSSQSLSLYGIGYCRYEQEIILGGEEFLCGLGFCNAKAAKVQEFKGNYLIKVKTSLSIADGKCKHLVCQRILEHSSEINLIAKWKEGKDTTGLCIDRAGKQTDATFGIFIAEVSVSLCSDSLA